jgi:hypothetical protein
MLTAPNTIAEAFDGDRTVVPVGHTADGFHEFPVARKTRSHASEMATSRLTVASLSAFGVPWIFKPYSMLAATVSQGNEVPCRGRAGPDHGFAVYKHFRYRGDRGRRSGGGWWTSRSLRARAERATRHHVRRAENASSTLNPRSSSSPSAPVD